MAVLFLIPTLLGAFFSPELLAEDGGGKLTSRKIVTCGRQDQDSSLEAFMRTFCPDSGWFDSHQEISHFNFWLEYDSVGKRVSSDLSSFGDCLRIERVDATSYLARLTRTYTMRGTDKERVKDAFEGLLRKHLLSSKGYYICEEVELNRLYQGYKYLHQISILSLRNPNFAALQLYFDVRWDSLKW